MKCLYVRSIQLVQLQSVESGLLISMAACGSVCLVAVLEQQM